MMERYRDTAMYGILFLFFFQLLSEFIASVYAFGLLGVEIPPETVCILFFLAPFLLLIPGKPLPDAARKAAGILALALGVIEMFPGTRGRMLLSGLGTACFLVYFSSAETGAEDGRPVRLTSGLALALSLSILWKTLGSGVYPYDDGWFRAGTAFLAAAGAVLLVMKPRAAATGASGDTPVPTIGFGRLLFTVIGMVSVVVLLFFAFSSPAVLTRWTEADRTLTIGMEIAALTFFAATLSIRGVRQTLAGPRILIPLNALFLITLLVAVLPHQVFFPSTPDSFPLPEPAPGPFAIPSFFVMILLFPVVLLDFLVLADRLLSARVSPREKAAAAGLGSLYLLLAVLAQVLTTVYDYVPVAGPVFRDRFFLVILVPGLVAAAAATALNRNTERLESAPFAVPAAVIILGLVSFTGAVLLRSRPHIVSPNTDGTVRVLTWNIQQGYSKGGERNVGSQLELMRQLDADIIGLEETDSARVAGGNTDLAGYFADRLSYHLYAGPKVVPGTFGLSLLSRYPIEDAKTFYMYSAGEQTAAIHARIRAGGRSFNVFVTHLGNDGDMVQQQAVLRETSGLENVILMGDFNFSPDTEQYRTTTGLLCDAWIARWPAGMDDSGDKPAKRIDHLFLSDGLSPEDIRYLDVSSSDHPVLVADLTTRS